MVKRSFIRGEKIIDEIVSKKFRDDIIKRAKEADQKKHMEEEGAVKQVSTVDKLLHQIKKDMIILLRRDSKVCSKIGIEEYQLEAFLRDPSALTPDDWQVLKKVKSEIEKYKQEIAEKEIDDEELIKDSRRKVAEKSENLNVKKGWKII